MVMLTDSVPPAVPTLGWLQLLGNALTVLLPVLALVIRSRFVKRKAARVRRRLAQYGERCASQDSRRNTTASRKQGQRLSASR
jgi:hypothetical protein